MFPNDLLITVEVQVSLPATVAALTGKEFRLIFNISLAPHASPFKELIIISILLCNLDIIYWEKNNIKVSLNMYTVYFTGR